MATNKYFDHLYNENEQDTFTDIVQEAIQQHGVDVTYIVRDMEDFDELLREEKLSVFRTTYKVDAYVVDAGQNSNMQKYMSKFGFRFEESTEIIISAKSWDEIHTGFPQPREGDYVYIGNPDSQYGSFINCMFQITQIWDGHPDTFQFGTISSYRLTLVVANKSYSNVMDTNYTDINDFLNPTEESENKTTIKQPADDFSDVNVMPSGNPFTKWGMN